MAKWPNFKDWGAWDMWGEWNQKQTQKQKEEEYKQVEQMKKLYEQMRASAMPTTPEAKVKSRVKQILANVNAYYIMPNTGGFGASGAPDFIVCLRGLFIGIECKAGKNTTTALQDKHLREIVNHGGIAMVVDEGTNMTEFQLKLIYLMENF